MGKMLHWLPLIISTILEFIIVYIISRWLKSFPGLLDHIYVFGVGFPFVALLLLVGWCEACTVAHYFSFAH